MNPNDVIQYIFYGLMSSTAIFIATSLSKLKNSIDNLNVSFAAEIEKLANVKNAIDKQDKTLERHSDRILELEKKAIICSNKK